MHVQLYCICTVISTVYPPFLLPLTGWPGHECRNGSRHMVLSECRGVSEEGRGDHQTVWDIHQTGALIKLCINQSTHNLEILYFYSPFHQICDLYECRIQANLDQMSHTLLLHLPTTETWTTEQFLMEAKVGRVNSTVYHRCQFAVLCVPMNLPSSLSHAVIQGHSCSVDAVVRLRKQWKNCWICCAPLLTCLVQVSLTLRRLSSQKKVERQFSLHEVILYKTVTQHVQSMSNLSWYSLQTLFHEWTLPTVWAVTCICSIVASTRMMNFW